MIAPLILLSLSLYLAYRIYKTRFYSLTGAGWFASIAFLAFAVMAFSKSLMLLRIDYAEAELLAKIAVTGAIVSGFFAIKSFMNRERSVQKSRSPSFHTLTFGAYTVIVIALTWMTTPFKMDLDRDLFGNMSYFPVPTIWYMLLLYAGLVLFSIHILRSEPNLLFHTNREGKSSSKIASILCISIAVSAFISDTALSYASLNMISLGYAIQIAILGVIVYMWRGPTIIEKFFVSLDKKGKRSDKKTVPVANRAILRVEAGSDYSHWVNDFLKNGEPEKNLILTHEGSRVIKSREFNEKCKIVCFSLSEDLPVRKVDDTLVVRLSEEIICEILRWALQNMKNGKLVFDNLSHLTLLVGAESAYTLVTMISELSNRYGVDALFILSEDTLDPKIQNALEELVDDVLTVKGNLICPAKH